jgi:hypothetical protein
MKRVWVLAALAALLLAACQSQARRLLLVDLTSSDPLVLEATAAPWHAAGYHVEYRRFYPHLTRHDLARYRTLVFLGGREPEGLSDALTIGDLAILTEWVRRDGVVILGYAAGTFDRWVMNRWLAAQGSGIDIGPQALDVAAVPLPSSALDNAGFAPFTAGRNQVLLVRNQSQTLARAILGSAPRDRPAIVAASRVKDGLIVVTSRELLAASDEDPRTRDFLVALARWTRRPAEWASVAPSMSPAPLTVAGAPQPVAVHPPPLTHPAGASVIALPEVIPPASAESRPVVPTWISRQGMRVLWSRFTPPVLGPLLDFVDVAALNALATAIPPSSLADTIGGGKYNIWRVTVERLQATSVRWFPGVRLVDLPSEGADEVDRHGELVQVPCGLDSLFWRSVIRPTYRALARLGGARPELIAGIALDLDTARTYYAASGFCDSDYRDGLASFGGGLDRAEIDRLAALPPAVRYDTLLERGLLERYYQRLENSVAERAIALRAELRRLHPDLRFAFRATDAPVDWFSVGLLRGLSTRETPALLWWRERKPRELLQRYRGRGIVALSALGIEPARVAANEWGRLKSLVFGQHDGFWLERTTSDSVSRLIRRMTK